MTSHEKRTLSGIIFDESTEITIVELCETCSIDRSLVDRMIEEGILAPIGDGMEDRRLQYDSVRRARIVIRLRRDLGVNLAGAALALELLDRIENMRTQLRRR